MFAMFSEGILYVGGAGAFACLPFSQGSLHIHLLGGIHYIFCKIIPYLGATFRPLKQVKNGMVVYVCRDVLQVSVL
jgi:hypothetical protein